MFNIWNLKTKINATLEQFDTKDDTSGDDRSMWRSTWAESLNLYKNCTSGQLIKQDDKDNYLPSKLFGVHFYFNNGGASTLYNFYINRMIANMFQRISRSQKLNSSALDALMKGIVSLDDLANKSKLTLTKFKSCSEFYTKIVEDVWVANATLKDIDGPNLLINLYTDIIGT